LWMKFIYGTNAIFRVLHKMFHSSMSDERSWLIAQRSALIL
jgi:hypothetical protein